MNEQQRTLVSGEEQQKTSRSVMIWLNGCPVLPDNVSRVDFEQLPADSPGMSLSVSQGPYIVRRYITGGHEAEYSFSILYRVIPGTSNDARLKADEALNAIGDWAVENWPELGGGIQVRKLETTARAALLAPYEDGSEDHSMQMKLNYEVI